MNTFEHCHTSSTFLFPTRYTVHVCRRTLISTNPIMNSSGPTITFLFKFSMSLAMYLYNTLLECFCCVMISMHLVDRLYQGIFRHIFMTTLHSMYDVNNK